MTQPRPEPADCVPLDTDLAEKVVWPLRLNEVQILIEGVNPEDGQPYRLRSSVPLRLADPKHLALVEVEPREPASATRVAAPSRHYLVVMAELAPSDTDGSVYVVEKLREREL